MRIIKLSLISLFFLIPLNLISQDSKINENINTNKFRQLYQEFSSPNMFRTASGAPGPAYYQQQAREQNEAFDNDLMREEHPSMPISVDRNTRVTFGGTKK